MATTNVPLTGLTTDWSGPYGQFQQFGPGNDLRGTAIMPTVTSPSATTGQYGQYVQNAAAQTANATLNPMQGVTPLSFDNASQYVTGANNMMQGLGYDFSGANNLYGSASNALNSGASAASSMLGVINPLSGMGGTAQANTGRFNSELDAALTGLDGPGRGEIAANTLELLAERSRPDFEASQRAAAQRVAAQGLQGSGMVNTRMADIVSQRESDLDLARRQLANEAAALTLQDRLDISDRQRGIANDRFGGEMFNAGLADSGMARQQAGSLAANNLSRQIALDVYGMGRDASGLAMDQGDRLRGQQDSLVGLGVNQAGFMRDTGLDLGNFTLGEYNAGVRERDTQRADEYDMQGNQRSNLSALSGLLSNERAQDAWDANQNAVLRQEARGERSYQDDMARRAQEQAIEQQIFNEMLRSGEWQRMIQSGGLGWGSDPSLALSNAASNANERARQLGGY